MFTAAVLAVMLQDNDFLKDVEFKTIESPQYSYEVPREWSVGEVTPWGARDIVPVSGSGKLGAMTAGPTRASWDDLYRTSLWFILQEERGTPTEYRIGETARGIASMSFEIVRPDGFASRRYTLLKNENGFALALSVRIPGPDEEEFYSAVFKRMVESAVFK